MYAIRAGLVSYLRERMMSQRSIGVLIAGMLAAAAMSQDLVLRGRVIDAATGRGIVDAHVRLKGTSTIAVSDVNGSFVLACPGPAAVTMEVSRVGYATLELEADAQACMDQEPFTVRLLPRAVDLPEVTIDRPKPEVVYQRDDLHVGDYFTNADGVWVLTYERPRLLHREDEAGKQVFRDARLHLLGHDFVERSSVRLPTDVCRLRHDAVHRVVVEGTSTAWVAMQEGGEVFLSAIDLKTLYEQVLPWTDSIPGQLLGSDLDPTFPAFQHVGYDLMAKASHTICTVQDDFRMELFRSQYKYMSGHDKVVAMDLALDTGVDAEIIAGYMTGFHKDIYFRSPYAPLFVVNDTLCVFDHYKERVRRYLPDHRMVDEIPIAYHRDRNWKHQLLQDRKDGSVYALYARNLRTWLRRVDPATGQLGPERALDHPFPEEVQVHDGYAYFIYRPYGSLQHRTLYRQAIH